MTVAKDTPVQVMMEKEPTQEQSSAETAPIAQPTECVPLKSSWHKAHTAQTLLTKPVGLIIEFRSYHHASLVKCMPVFATSQYDATLHSVTLQPPVVWVPDCSTQDEAVISGKAPKVEIVPEQPKTLDADVLVETKMLICSISGLGLREVEKAMEEVAKRHPKNLSPQPGPRRSSLTAS